MMRMPEGSVMRGTADLVLETRAGLVVVDHKTFGGGVEDGDERVVEWGAQIGAYADALERASERKVRGRFVHLPVSGITVEMTRSE